MDTSLYRSYNNDTKRKSKAHRQMLHQTKLPADEIEANRTWRRTVNILKLGDTKREIVELEKATYWSNVVATIVKQKIRDDKELVARLNHKVLLSR